MSVNKVADALGPGTFYYGNYWLLAWRKLEFYIIWRILGNGYMYLYKF